MGIHDRLTRVDEVRRPLQFERLHNECHQVLAGHDHIRSAQRFATKQNAVESQSSYPGASSLAAAESKTSASACTWLCHCVSSSGTSTASTSCDSSELSDRRALTAA